MEKKLHCFENVSILHQKCFYWIWYFNFELSSSTTTYMYCGDDIQAFFKNICCT